LTGYSEMAGSSSSSALVEFGFIGALIAGSANQPRGQGAPASTSAHYSVAGEAHVPVAGSSAPKLREPFNRFSFPVHTARWTSSTNCSNTRRYRWTQAR